MTVCVISQPRLFPGLHYLDRMKQADVFVVFDNVQFNPRHEENRFRVRTQRGPEWVTASVEKGPRERILRDVKMSADVPWIDACKNALQLHYGNAPFYAQNIGAVRSILDGNHSHLIDLDMASWEPALSVMRPRCDFVRASTLGCDGKGPQLLLDICKRVGADVYLSGAFGREYLDVEMFAKEGVETRFHEHEPRAYPQRAERFEPFLSYLDAWFEADMAPLRDD